MRTRPRGPHHSHRVTEQVIQRATLCAVAQSCVLNVALDQATTLQHLTHTRCDLLDELLQLVRVGRGKRRRTTRAPAGGVVHDRRPCIGRGTTDYDVRMSSGLGKSFWFDQKCRVTPGFGT
jgi:hypothetical protein